MLKKKIAAAVAAIMTISSLGTIALAADGDSYDKLLGNELVEGTFEHGVNVGADRWVQKANVSHVIDNTHNGSAGAILVDQSASTVYSGFSMKSNRIYHAEAYIKLYNNTSDKAKLVLATKNGSDFQPITSTAVMTDVNGTDWTRLEGDFLRNSSADDVADVFCYIELDNETTFYLDDVIIKDDNCFFSAGTTIEAIIDENGVTSLVGKLVADSEGKAKVTVKPLFLSKTDYVISSNLMLQENSSATAEAKAYYKKLFSETDGIVTELVSGSYVSAAVEGQPNSAATSTAKDAGIKITGAAEGDIIYFDGIKAEPEKGTAAATATATIDSFEALAGQNCQPVISADANTVALRYFYSVDGVLVKAGHTNAGDTSVPTISVSADYIGKTVKLEVEPLNSDCVYGAKVAAASVVKAPFEAGAITPVVNAEADTVTASFDITNTTSASQYVAAVVAYYNSNNEMIGIGIENKQIASHCAESFDVTVNIEPEAGDYSKLYILDGDTTDGILELFPLAKTK